MLPREQPTGRAEPCHHSWLRRDGSRWGHGHTASLPHPHLPALSECHCITEETLMVNQRCLTPCVSMGALCVRTPLLSPGHGRRGVLTGYLTGRSCPQSPCPRPFHSRITSRPHGLCVGRIRAAPSTGTVPHQGGAGP